MRILSYLAFFLFLSVSLPVCSQKRVEVDVCIYGGTSAGVIAAYTARKLGQSVILIEPGNRLGGMSSGGLGYTDIGNKYAITGLARDFYRRIGLRYGKFEQWIFEPRVAQMVFQQYIDEAEVRVLYETRVKEVSKNGTRIMEAIFEDAENPSTFTNTIVTAKIFMDCGYEGDLMARAGVSYVVGREANATYNETINGVQLMKGHQFPDGIDPYREKGNPSSGLVWGVSDAALESNGTGDAKVQAYNYRICLTSDPANRITITRPEGYDSARYELALRLMESNPGKRKLNDYFIWSRMPANKTDINNRGGFSTDMIGMNYDYPEADYDTRKRIVRDHELYTKGLLYFFGHDPRVPVALREEMQQWGYPRDEFEENDHWSPQLYVREARRMVGSYVMTQHNCEGREVVPDGVGMAAYTMDSHNCQRIVVDGNVKNEGNVEVGGFGPYPIAYRSIIPKPGECTNLFVPVCLSASHIAYGSIRMEPVFMVLAQSAAFAARLAIERKIDIDKVDIEELQRQLGENPLATNAIADILIDNDDQGRVTVKGLWERQTKGGYGPSYLVHQDERKPGSVRFTPDIPTDGDYAIYAYLPKIANVSKSIPVIVHTGNTRREVVIITDDVVVEGQTSGEWAPLGTFTMKKGRKGYAEISTRNADSHVVADAIIWVRTK